MGEEQTEGGKRSAPRWTQTATTLAGIVSVFLVALGLYITNAQNRAQQQLTEQGQITERFGRAIDQLGSDKLDVRLGGVYALEALMHEPHADERNIIEVLSAYVRDHPASTAGPLTLHRRGDLLPTRKLPTDVQAALTVLGRRPDPAHNTGIDLTGAHISGADLRGADLTSADLTSGRGALPGTPHRPGRAAASLDHDRRDGRALHRVGLRRRRAVPWPRLPGAGAGVGPDPAGSRGAGRRGARNRLARRSLVDGPGRGRRRLAGSGSVGQARHR